MAVYYKVWQVTEDIWQAGYWEGGHAESAPPSLHIAPYPLLADWPMPTPA